MVLRGHPPAGGALSVSRKREPMAANWAQDRLLEETAKHLTEANDEEIEATADDLQVDPRRLIAFVSDIRRRNGITPPG